MADKVVKDKTAGWDPKPTYVDWEDIFTAMERIRVKNVHGYGYDEEVLEDVLGDDGKPVQGDDGNNKKKSVFYPWRNAPFKDDKGNVLDSGKGTVLPFVLEIKKDKTSEYGPGGNALRTNCVSSTLNALCVTLASLSPDKRGMHYPRLAGGQKLPKNAYERWYIFKGTPEEGGPGALVAYNIGVQIEAASLRRGDVIQIYWGSVNKSGQVVPNGGGHCVYCWDARHDDDLWIQVISSQSSTRGVGVMVGHETLSKHGTMEEVLRARSSASPVKQPVYAPPLDKPWLTTPEARAFYRTGGHWLRIPGKKGDSGSLAAKVFAGRFHRLFPRYPIALQGSNHVSDPDPLPAGDGNTPQARTRSVSSALYFANNEGTRESPRKGGFFPIASSRHWHGGVHLYPDKDEQVYAPCDGVLVAARLSTPDNVSQVGDAGFVLIKTKLSIDSKEVTFFTLLYHLRAPGDDAKKVPWLDDLLALPPDDDPRWTLKLDSTKHWRKVLAVPEKPHRKRKGTDSEDQGLVVFEKADPKSDQKGTIATGTIVETTEQLDGRGWAKIKTQDGSLEGYCHGEGRLEVVHTLDSKLKDKRASLLKGDVVDFSDLDRNFLLRAGEVVGLAGTAGGDKAVHFQIFSTDMIPFEDKQKADVEDTTDELFTDRSKFEDKFSEMFDKSDPTHKEKDPSFIHWMINFVTRKEDDLLTADEVCAFFAASPHRDKARDKVTRHLSEWGDKIDWKKLDSQPQWKHASQAAKDAFHADLQKLLWWTSGVGKNAGLPDDQICYHYHPIAFLAWLDEKRENDSDGSLHASVFDLNHGGVA